RKGLLGGAVAWPVAALSVSRRQTLTRRIEYSSLGARISRPSSAAQMIGRLSSECGAVLDAVRFDRAHRHHALRGDVLSDARSSGVGATPAPGCACANRIVCFARASSPVRMIRDVPV